MASELRKAMKVYEGLLNNIYYYILKDDKTITLEFTESNFLHLIGIHKLDDNDLAKNLSSKDRSTVKIANESICQAIKAGNEKSLKLEESLKFEIVKEKVGCIKYLPKILEKPENKQLIKYDKSKNFPKFISKLDKVSYMAYKTSKDNYILFAIGYDGRKKRYFPNTFLVVSKKDLWQLTNYIYNQDCVKIVETSIKNNVYI